MAAVTQTIPTYLGGVSKQIDNKKIPGQVRECLNAYPDPTFGLMKRPGTKFIKTLTTSALTNAKWFYIHRDGDEQYIGRISTGSPGDIAIWNATTGVACTVTYPTASHQNYLQPRSGVADKPNLNYDILTVQDTTFITNKTTYITTQADPTHTANKVATIRLKRVRYGSRYRITINGNQTADYVTPMEDASGASEVLSSKDILSQLVTNINALSISGMATPVELPASIELSCSSAFTITAEDDSGNENLEVFQEQVNNVSDLPSQSTQNRLVKVINTLSDKDTYWAKFIPNSGTSGPGYWEEALAPDKSAGLTASTMPHELFNDAPNSFKFKEIGWKARLVGDDVTNEHPSFATGDKSIQQTFLYNNRLGFLTEDNVSISQAADYYNFYFTSAQTATASDPIDLSCSSIRPAVLHGVIPTAQGLILFSKNQQFMMFATEGILTPSTALIRSISNYEMDTNIDPVDVGTTINFVSKTPSYSRLFGMQTKGFEESPLIQDISRVVSEWIPADIDSLLTSPQNLITAVYGTSIPTIYMYRVYSVGKDELMQAWFKWQMPGNVQHCTVDNDVMWTVVQEGTNYILLKSSISKSTSEDILVTDDGKQINPHMDMFAYPTASDKVTFANNESKIYLPYTDITSLTPVILIKGSGVTDSGFTITPGRGSDGGGSYFTVPNKDLTSTTYTDIAVGYKYDYDVELPRTYYKVGGDQTRSDYGANLTIARMKFAVGLSSVVGFKLKSKGYRGPLAERVGDGSTTAFSVPFPLKVENGITVKLDGAVTKAYTVTTTDSQGTVTFSTAPSGASTAANVTTPAQKIEITTNTWYDIQPVQDSNEYLADDVPLAEENVFTLPIHQRTDNFNLRVFSNSPFPVSLNSMMWEGQYSPRYYRRT